MPFDAHANFAVSAVATAPIPAASGVTLTVEAGHGARFPSLTAFNATVHPAGVTPDDTNAEIVRVTSIAGDVLTITRAQEDSTARSILAGDRIYAAITRKTLTDIEVPFDDHVALTESVHGLPDAAAGETIVRNPADTGWDAVAPSAAALGAAVILAPATSPRNVIQPLSAAVVPLTVKGAVAQSVALLEGQLSDGTVVAALRPGGALDVGPNVTTLDALRVGETAVGEPGLARLNLDNATDFLLAQTAAGYARLNVPVGQSLNLCQGGVNRVGIAGTSGRFEFLGTVNQESAFNCAPTHRTDSSGQSIAVWAGVYVPGLPNLTGHGMNFVTTVTDAAGVSNNVDTYNLMRARLDTAATYNGTITNTVGFKAENPARAGANSAVHTNVYGLRVADLSEGVNSYAVFIEGTGGLPRNGVTFGAAPAGDTNLYRSAADVLKTDDSFHVALNLRHLGSNLGFYGVAQVARPAAYTQTYATAARTHVQTAASTAHSFSTLFANSEIEAACNALGTRVNELKALVNQVIDDGQNVGLLQ